MAYTRTYTTTVPVEAGEDFDQLRWLMRESFERKASADCLRVVEYDEQQLDATDLPPKGVQQWGGSEATQWWQFTATATVDTAAVEAIESDMQAAEAAAAEADSVAP